MKVVPINSKRVYQEIIEQFIEMLKSGKLTVGQKLPPERTLAEMFNVSRPSIREAFRALEIIGLIEVKPGGGTYVTDLNISNFINTIAPLFLKNESMEKEMLEFRTLIEAEAVKLASQKITENKTDNLDYAMKLMEKSIKNDDINLGIEADILFHKAIFSLTENYILTKASEYLAFILESSVRFNRAKILENKDKSKELFIQHTMIYEAIKSSNPKLAVELMKKHLYYVHELD